MYIQRILIVPTFFQGDGSKLKRAPSWRKKFRSTTGRDTSVNRLRDGTTVKVLSNDTIGLNGDSSLEPGSPKRSSTSSREKREGSVESATASCISKRT